MSPSPAGGASWAARWRLVAALAVVGATLGALLAAADPPEYESRASVVVTRDRGAADPLRIRRIAELAGGSQVAEQAASLLGDDLPGADLLTRVTVSAEQASGLLSVTTRAQSADLAPAVAEAYAAAVVAVLGGGLEVGAAATPGHEVGGRSLPLWALLGLLSGALVGVGLAAALQRGLIRADRLPIPRRPAAEEQPREAPQAGPSTALPPPDRIVDLRGDGSVGLSVAATDALAEPLVRLGSRRPTTLAVLAHGADDATSAAAAAIAVGAAGRGTYVVLVDGRSKAPAVAPLLGVTPDPGLAEYLRGEAAPDRVLRALEATGSGRGRNRFALVPAGSGDGGEGVAGARFSELIARLREVYELIVVAGPELGDRRRSAALADAADGLVIVCDDDPACREEAARRAERLRGATLHAVLGIGRA